MSFTRNLWGTGSRHSPESEDFFRDDRSALFVNFREQNPFHTEQEYRQIVGILTAARPPTTSGSMYSFSSNLL